VKSSAKYLLVEVIDFGALRVRPTANTPPFIDGLRAHLALFQFMIRGLSVVAYYLINNSIIVYC
jgi:hypothetical protein